MAPEKTTTGGKREDSKRGLGRELARSSVAGQIAVRKCPRQESNLRTWFRKPLLFH